MPDALTENGAGGAGVRDSETLPLAFIFGDDFLVHHMSVDADATVRDICSTAAGFINGTRVPEESGEFRLMFDGTEQPLDERARDVGIGWLDYVEISVAN